MLKKNLPRITLIIVVLICAGVGGYAWSTGSSDRPAFVRSTVTVTRADGQKFNYAVEAANTEAQQSYGLMYLHSMPDNAGMIFPYNPPREVAFWMKNTFIPLDMLFVGADGHIGHIATDARPLDVTPITSDIEVSSVIELNAGQVKQKGFAIGDKVDYANEH